MEIYGRACGCRWEWSALVGRSSQRWRTSRMSSSNYRLGKCGSNLGVVGRDGDRLGCRLDHRGRCIRHSGRFSDLRLSALGAQSTPADISQQPVLLFPSFSDPSQLSFRPLDPRVDFISERGRRHCSFILAAFVSLGPTRRPLFWPVESPVLLHHLCLTPVTDRAERHRLHHLTSRAQH